MPDHYDHIEISDISDKDTWVEGPLSPEIDISECNYRIEAKTDKGPRGTQTTTAFATRVTINGNFDLGVGSEAAITGTGIAIETDDEPGRRYNIVLGL